MKQLQATEPVQSTPIIFVKTFKNYKANSSLLNTLLLSVLSILLPLIHCHALILHRVKKYDERKSLAYFGYSTVCKGC